MKTKEPIDFEGGRFGGFLQMWYDFIYNKWWELKKTVHEMEFRLCWNKQNKNWAEVKNTGSVRAGNEHSCSFPPFDKYVLG